MNTVRLLPRRRFSCTLYYKIVVETQVNKIVDGLARPRAASDRDDKRKITDLSRIAERICCLLDFLHPSGNISPLCFFL